MNRDLYSFILDLQDILINTFGIMSWGGPFMPHNNRRMYKLNISDPPTWFILIKTRITQDPTEPPYALFVVHGDDEQGQPHDSIHPNNMYEVTLWLNHVITHAPG